MNNATDKGPVFIGGAGRSGTSLLRVILDSHPHICSGPELKILPEVARLWSALTGPLQSVMQSYGNSDDDVSRALSRMVDGLTERLRERTGKQRWAEKTPHNVLHMAVLGRIFPDAQFVHVVRDGRDVACSLITMNWGDPRTGRKVEYCQNIPAAARYWRQVIETARQQIGDPALSGRVHEVRYEDIVLHPEPTLRKLLAFLDEPWDDGVLAHHVRDHVQTGDESSDRQVQQPLYENSIGRWQREMSELERAAFMQAAGETLSELGYGTE